VFRIMLILTFVVGMALSRNTNMADQQTPVTAQAAPEAELLKRLAQAEIVVSGVIQSVSRYGAAKPDFLSTHDPQWWQATIEVQSVEKGNLSGKTIQVLFASSKDVAWYQSPKLKAGDHGVWLLQNRDPFGKAVPAPAVVSPHDVQPIGELGHVRTLLKSGSKK
jgi:hypothetical protein